MKEQDKKTEHMTEKQAKQRLLEIDIVTVCGVVVIATAPAGLLTLVILWLT